MHVEIYSANEEGRISIGVLRLVDGVVVAEPDVPLLKLILKRPIFDPSAGVVWSASKNPLEFLHALANEYRSPYLHASEPQGGLSGA